MEKNTLLVWRIGQPGLAPHCSANHSDLRTFSFLPSERYGLECCKITKELSEPCCLAVGLFWAVRGELLSSQATLPRCSTGSAPQMTPRLWTETQATFLCQDPLCAESYGGGGSRVLRRRGLRLRLRAINHWAGRSLGQHPWAIQRVRTVSARRRESGKEKSEDGEKLMKTFVLFRKLGLCPKKKSPVMTS